MIIDFHTHIFPPEVRHRREEYVQRDPTFAEMYADPRAKIATAEDLLASMDASGVDVSVALGFAWQLDEAGLIERHNDYLLESAATSGGRIVAYCATGSTDEADRCAVKGARGLGELRPDNQGWKPTDPSGTAIAATARRLKLALLFHVTEPGERAYPGRNGCDLSAFTAFARIHTSVPIVGAHLGGGIYSLKRDVAQDAYVDTAALPFLYKGEEAHRMVADVPANRLLFGSDFPLISQRRALEELRPLIEGNEQPVLGGNAAKLLGLP